MKKATDSVNQMHAARKEIRANIRTELNMERLPSKLDDELAETMDQLLENENHPINKLFALARLNRSNPDHWRVLTFIMVDEIFGSVQRGAPPKGSAEIKNWELLSYLNEIHRMRIEDGHPADVTDCILDLPAFFRVLANNVETQEMAKRYEKAKPSTLKRYVHTALTESAKRLRNRPKELDQTLAGIVERALDEFRPDWRRLK